MGGWCGCGCCGSGDRGAAEESCKTADHGGHFILIQLSLRGAGVDVVFVVGGEEVESCGVARLEIVGVLE